MPNPTLGHCRQIRRPFHNKTGKSFRFKWRERQRSIGEETCQAAVAGSQTVGRTIPFHSLLPSEKGFWQPVAYVDLHDRSGHSGSLNRDSSAVIYEVGTYSGLITVIGKECRSSTLTAGAFRLILNRSEPTPLNTMSKPVTRRLSFPRRMLPMRDSSGRSGRVFRCREWGFRRPAKSCQHSESTGWAGRFQPNP